MPVLPLTSLLLIRDPNIPPEYTYAWSKLSEERVSYVLQVRAEFSSWRTSSPLGIFFPSTISFSHFLNLTSSTHIVVVTGRK